MIKIVIPSMGRYDKPVITAQYVANTILCVPEAEAAAYQRQNPNVEIHAHSDSMLGLGRKLNYIMETFGDVFMMDDDLKGIRCNAIPIGGKGRVLEPHVAWEYIQWLGNMARQAECVFFGMGNRINPLMFNPETPFKMSGFIIGGGTGVLENSYLRVDENIKVKNDVCLSALNAYFFRKCFIDNRFVIGMGSGIGNTKGGLQSIRTPQVEYENAIYLRKKFGESIKVKFGTSMKPNKNKFGISFSPPI